MKAINRQMIRKLFPSHIYNRGVKYYESKRVLGLTYDRNHQTWTAHVHGTEIYFVDINLTELNDGTIRTSCNCPAFEVYGSCKHIVAVLLKIADQTEDRLSFYGYDVTKTFINLITNLQQQEQATVNDNTTLKVEFKGKLNDEAKLVIEIKIGVKHCYVVRDVRKFLESVLKGKEYFFTQRFTYLPNEHNFYKQDLEIFEMLYGFLITEDVYRDTDQLSYNTKTTSKRAVIVPPIGASKLLTLLIERDFSVEIGEQTYHSIAIKRGQLPYQFSVTTKNEELILHIQQVTNSIYLDYYQLLFSDGIFYYPNEKQYKLIQQIARLGMIDHELPIAKQQADTFFSEALPTLKQTVNVDISEKVAKEIVEVPLRAKLYLEEKENLIIGKLEYHYNEHVINPFNGRLKHDVVIIRDVEKEQQIMNLIEQANFHYNGKELYLDIVEDDELYEFLYEILPQLDEHVELFLTAAIRHFIVENEPVPTTDVKVDSGNNLLEIGFNIDGVDKEEVGRILQAVIEKKRYYRLESGALISLENDEFSSIERLFVNLKVDEESINACQVKLPVYRSTQVDELIKTRKSYHPSFRQLLHQLKSPEEQMFSLPENLRATLRGYQKTGYQWFKSLSTYHLGGILADDMGLGKTVQSIAYLLSEVSEWPHLIVVPSSVVYNWRNECRKFAPDLKVAVLVGTPKEREQEIVEAKDKDVWITSYGTIRQDIELYRDLMFHSLILDEAQYIKNYATKTSKAIREINASRRFALSGTPIENSVDELWSIFQVVLPGLMPNQREFRQLAPEKIASITKPFILRRLKTDVLKELPEKIESVHISELTQEQKKLYVGYLQQIQQEASESITEAGFQASRMKILAGLTRLRQLCCHPALFIENYQGASGKLIELIETVQMMLANGRRLLIFSQFTSMHELIIEELSRLNIDYFYLHGQTKPEQRVDMSERFNNGEKDVFLISLRAGGTGLNLTGADTVILFDLWWNPAVEDQATGRAHRFGQKNVVQVIRFITEGTIEEKIYELQQKKRTLIDQVIQPGETMLSSLSEEDVRELLNI